MRPEPWVGLGGVLVLAALATVLLTPVGILLANRFGAVDDPRRDSRRIHTEVTPRWGGLGVFASFLLVTWLTAGAMFPTSPWPPYLVGVLSAGALLTVMGMVDDRFGLSARYQTIYMVVTGFGVQVFSGPDGAVRLAGPLVVASVGTALYLFVATKTMDTIDGVDGLASGLALISSLTLVALAWMGGHHRTALMAATLAGCCLGFLKWNSAPARIFLAGGAQFVGFVLGCVSLLGPMRTAGPLGALLPWMVFGVPVIDAVVVVLRRVKAGAHVTQGDRRHTHHALLDAGLSKRQVVWVLCGVQVVLCGVFLFLAFVFRPG